jgi:hypothetical protein
MKNQTKLEKEILIKELVKTKREMREREIRTVRALEAFRIDIAFAYLKCKRRLRINKLL